MRTISTYRKLMDQYGRRVTIERPVVNGVPLSAPAVRARIRGATQDEIAGGISASSRRVLVLAADLPPEMAPLRKNDRLIVDGIRLTFTERPDDQTHRDGDLLLAYDGVASGG